MSTLHALRGFVESSAWRVGLVAMGLAACTVLPALPTDADRRTLAPSGPLRVGVYPGSPVSMVRDGRTGAAKGISVGMGQALAVRLGVPYEQVEFGRLSDVIDAVRESRVDLIVTNATASRAQVIDFSGTLIEIEQGYLVMGDSPLSSAQAVDRVGVRVVVVQGSTSQAVLPGKLLQATVVSAPSIEQAKGMLSRHEADAFATQKSILHEVAATLTNGRVLDGRYGIEQIAVGVPKGRRQALPFLRAFVEKAKADGTVARLIEDVGLKGSAVAAAETP
jgi:polar amino acid transport system substrate-binding protein